MADLTLDVIRARVTSLMTRAPFAFTVSPEPFGIDRVPASLVEGSCCLETTSGRVTGGMRYTETRVDFLQLSVARTHKSQVDACYRALLADCTSLTAAITRDGAELGGDYDVVDEGQSFAITHVPGSAFSVLRLTLPVDYEAQL
jgi:hypothetical protein